MRVVFIGCVAYSAATLRALIPSEACQLVGVVTRRASAKTTEMNADFCSLETIAAEARIPCFLAQGNQQGELADWIASKAPDVIYCFGWSYLLRSRILAIAPLGVVGYHPAALPRNRGRHPIIWALALGLRETASSFFFMDEGADSGDLLSQRRLEIHDEDDAASLYRRLTELSLVQIAEFTPALSRGTHQRIPQDHALANVWRKRGHLDGQIDWRMSADSVHNLVRALTRPYVGAHCLWQGEEVKIWKVRALSAAGLDGLEPGKVLEQAGGRLIIKCGDGAVELVEHGFGRLPPAGAYL